MIQIGLNVAKPALEPVEKEVVLVQEVLLKEYWALSFRLPDSFLTEMAEITLKLSVPLIHQEESQFDWSSCYKSNRGAGEAEGRASCEKSLVGEAKTRHHDKALLYQLPFDVWQARMGFSFLGDLEFSDRGS